MANFVWGNGGQQITSPQQAERQRQIAEALIGQAATPGSNWAEGLSDVAAAFSGVQIQNQAAAAEEAGRLTAAQALAGITPQSGFSDISAALANPWLSQPQASVASALLQQNLERNDPRYQLGLQQDQLGLKMAQLKYDQMINPAPQLYDPNAPTSWQEFQLGQTNPDYAATLGDSPLVQVNTGDTNDFFTGLAAAEGENFAGFLTGGQSAARNLNQIDRLEGLLQETPQGLAGASTQLAGNLGIDIGNASGVQAAQALINTLVPNQRPPGSGPMSDADLELFKQSLPRIINQPNGNQLIIETIRGINNYDLELARITQEGLAAAEMTEDPSERARIRQDMRARINSLQNPIDRIRDLAGSNGTTGGGGSYRIIGVE